MGSPFIPRMLFEVWNDFFKEIFLNREEQELTEQEKDLKNNTTQFLMVIANTVSSDPDRTEIILKKLIQHCDDEIRALSQINFHVPLYTLDENNHLKKLTRLYQKTRIFLELYKREMESTAGYVFNKSSIVKKLDSMEDEAQRLKKQHKASLNNALKLIKNLKVFVINLELFSSKMTTTRNWEDYTVFLDVIFHPGNFRPTKEMGQVEVTASGYFDAVGQYITFYNIALRKNEAFNFFEAHNNECLTGQLKGIYEWAINKNYHLEVEIETSNIVSEWKECVETIIIEIQTNPSVSMNALKENFFCSISKVFPFEFSREIMAYSQGKFRADEFLLQIIKKLPNDLGENVVTQLKYFFHDYLEVAGITDSVGEENVAERAEENILERAENVEFYSPFYANNQNKDTIFSKFKRNWDVSLESRFAIKNVSYSIVNFRLDESISIASADLIRAIDEAKTYQDGVTASDLICINGVTQPLFHAALRLNELDLIKKINELSGFRWDMSNPVNDESCFHAISSAEQLNPERIIDFYLAAKREDNVLIELVDLKKNTFFHVLLNNQDAREKETLHVFEFFFELLKQEKQYELITRLLISLNNKDQNIIMLSAKRGFGNLANYLMDFLATVVSLETDIITQQKILNIAFYPGSVIEKSPIYWASKVIDIFVLMDFGKKGALQLLEEKHKKAFPMALVNTVIFENMPLGWRPEIVLTHIQELKMPFSYWLALYCTAFQKSTDFFEKAKLMSTIKLLLKQEPSYSVRLPNDIFQTMRQSDVNIALLQSNISAFQNTLNQWELYFVAHKNEKKGFSIFKGDALKSLLFLTLPGTILIISVSILSYYSFFIKNTQYLWEQKNAVIANGCENNNGSISYMTETIRGMQETILCMTTKYSLSSTFLEICCTNSQECFDEFYPLCLENINTYANLTSSAIGIVLPGISGAMVLMFVLAYLIFYIKTLYPKLKASYVSPEIKENFAVFHNSIIELYKKFHDVGLVNTSELEQAKSCMTSALTYQTIKPLLTNALLILERYRIEEYAQAIPIQFPETFALPQRFEEENTKPNTFKSIVRAWEASARKVPGYGAVPMEDYDALEAGRAPNNDLLTRSRSFN